MAIKPEVLDALLAAGASAEMIVAAVKADIQAQEEANEARRARDAERQRRHRLSRRVTVTERDDEQGFPDKEKSPRPPKEINPSNSGSNEPDGGAVDPSKIMFDAGVSLIRQCGKSESAARSWLAKARQQHGPEAVIAAIGAAKREGAIDPISFMQATLQSRQRQTADAWVSPC